MENKYFAEKVDQKSLFLSRTGLMEAFQLGLASKACLIWVQN